MSDILDQRKIPEEEMKRLRKRSYPFPWYQLTNYQTVEEDRYFSCPIYKECLARAARGRWVGFTCRFCSNFKPSGKED